LRRGLTYCTVRSGETHTEKKMGGDGRICSKWNSSDILNVSGVSSFHETLFIILCICFLCFFLMGIVFPWFYKESGTQIHTTEDSNMDSGSVYHILLFYIYLHT